MWITCLAKISVVLYITAFVIESLHTSGKLIKKPTLTLITGTLAALLHAWLLYQWIDVHPGHNLNSYNLASMTAWGIAVIMLITHIFKEVISLGIFIFPLCALSIVAAEFIGGEPVIETVANPLELVHILTAILSFCLLGVAGMQGLLLTIQAKSLKQANFFLKILPSMQAMNNLFLEFLIAGFVLLLVSLLSGFLTSQNDMLQAFSTKIILSVIATLLFGLIIVMRLLKQWGTQSTIKATWVALIILLGAYFGTRYINF